MLHYDMVDRKTYDEVENNRPHACKKFYATQGILLNKNLLISKSVKVICRFDSLRTAHSKRQKAVLELEKLLSTLAFELYSAEG